MATKVISWKKPIIKGFPFSGLLYFRVGENPVNLSEYNLLLAISPSPSALNVAKVVPTITSSGNSAVFTFDAAVTANMAVGFWVGSICLKKISNSYVSHVAGFKIVVEEILIP